MNVVPTSDDLDYKPSGCELVIAEGFDEGHSDQHAHKPAVWLLRAAGWRLARAAIAVAVLLGAIEVIQIHLLGRVAGNLSLTKVRGYEVESPRWE